MRKVPLSLLASLVLLGVGAPLTVLARPAAPDAVEPSIQAPLASHSLLLDAEFVEGLAVAVGEAARKNSIPSCRLSSPKAIPIPTSSKGETISLKKTANSMARL